MKNRILYFLIPVLLLGGIIIGFNLQEIFSREKSYSPSDKFDEVLGYAEKYYYKDLDENKLVEDAINGMLNELDPHSIYIPAEQQVEINEQFKGQFDGIGIEFQIINDTITVVSAISGSPSESVGIIPGDRIIEINSKSTIGFTNADVVSNLRGEKGTSVLLKIHRPFVKNILSFSVIRDQIPLNTVEIALMVNNSIGYIALSKFVETSIYEMKDALKQLKEFGMRKLILDLRNNPGGYMDQAVQIADLFLDSNKVILSTKGKISEFDEVINAEKKYPYEDLPLAILVNKGSASSSEILSGAIQDWDRGIIVGETTFGKGLVQRPFILPDNSAVRITISKYRTPSGREIQRNYENQVDYFGVIYSTNEKEGENFNHVAEADTTSKIFHTHSGRAIKANGGITPDFIVKNIELTYYSVLLRSKDLFFQFIRKYLDKNSNNFLNTYGRDFKIFDEKFSFTQNDVNEFIKFASDNGVNFVNEEFEKDRNDIILRLKAEIAKNYWKNNGWFLIMSQADKQFLKAEELLIKNISISTNDKL